MVEMDGGKIFRVTGCTKFAVHAGYVRIVGDLGNAETLRFLRDKVSLTFNPWDVPEEMAHAGHQIDYIPPVEPEVAKALSRGLTTAGHNVADFRCTRNYINELAEGKAPDMDVYRSVAMSAVAILGWRSALEGKEFEIPDFKDPAAREQYRNDDLSPWRSEIPWHIYPAQPE